MNRSVVPTPPGNVEFLAGGGESGARMRAFDWSSTALGAPSQWPQSLRTIVRVMLDSRYAMWMLWGAEYTFFCNDAYLPTVGIKRDWVIGARSDKVWEEIWPDIGPRIAHVLEHGQATWDEGLLLFLERSGFPEETYHTFSYSPVYDDGSRIAGMLCVVTEVTDGVISERRLGLLRDFAAAVAGADNAMRTSQLACDVLARYPLDLSFAALYLTDVGRQRAELVALTRAEVARIVPQSIALAGDDLRRLRVTLDDLPAAGAVIASVPWPDIVRRALLLPLQGAEGVAGYLVAAPSTRRVLDEPYLAFFDLIAGRMASAIAEAAARDAARQRAEALAELDRAKTKFFSNISHEFRTPLTLMLAPVEEALADPRLAARSRERLELVRRNAQRLQRLVNSLLDFSRIEAGRMQVTYEAVDLAALTRDLASTFRSAIERAGLEFHVRCQDLGADVFVDRDMWEKIVLNLLSNAFKFTLTGAIEVRLSGHDEGAVFEVADTGIGVPAGDITRMFERFHRVEGSFGRTNEGSGIGLALVTELVKLHGGSIDAESTPGVGTTFRVRIPRGSAHLPAGSIRVPSKRAPAAFGAQAFVQEALGWLSEPTDGTGPAAPTLDGSLASQRDRRFAKTFGSRIVIADDNADMRGYLRELLAPFYSIETVGDGEQALLAARRSRPDLIVSDVMMPRLDGLGLIAALRGDAALREVAIVLLSARAGEEARIEGLDAGADDYLVKPFSARELLARVGALLELGQMRRANEDRLRLGLRAAHMVVWDWDLVTGEQHFSQNAAQVFGGEWRDVADGMAIIHPEDLPPFRAAVNEAIRSAGAIATELRIRRPDTGEQRWLEVRGRVQSDGSGVASRLTGVSIDITERKRTQALLAEQQAVLERRTAQFGSLLAGAPLGVYLVDADLRICEVNPTAARMFGADVIGRQFAATVRTLWPPHYAEELIRLFRYTLETGESHARAEAIEQRADTGATEAYEWQINRIPLPEGRHGVVCYFRDISAPVEARSVLIRQREALRAMDRQKDEFLAMLAHELRNPLAPIRSASELLARSDADPRTRMAVGIVKRQAAQLTRLVDDLLDMSRITRGRIELKLGPVALADVIAQAVETVEPLLRDKQQRLELQIQTQALRVNGDAARLVQCLTNILTNAVKYSGHGGRIEVEARGADGQALIAISDNGAGIAAELLPQVFDLFVQSQRTLDRAQGGLGIGLSLVRRLVEMQGGTVHASSAGPGLGACFEIRLPLLERAGTNTAADLRAEVTRRRVLVVDDNEDAANSLAMVLELDGHDVRPVYGAAQALDMLLSFRPEVVLLDIGLPEMDGYELARRIRAREGYASVLLVAVTGYGQAEDRKRALAAGLDGHLTKPVDFAALEELLNRT